MSDDEYHNLLNLSIYIDTHILDASDEAAVTLRRLHKEGWIALARTDVIDTELASASTELRDTLTTLSSEYPETLGPMVLGHSRLGASVLASADDATRLDAVWSILYPGVNRATARKSHFRDAMHVATAIRYGAYAFVTRDRRILNKHAAVAEAFNGFRIWSPEEAVAYAFKRISKSRQLHRMEPERGTLPEWPPAAEPESPPPVESEQTGDR
ncbi:MAG TPA: hypothetical protein VGD67_19495 [Pseudonocardiaceae bacterium]